MEGLILNLSKDEVFASRPARPKMALSRGPSDTMTTTPAANPLRLYQRDLDIGAFNQAKARRLFEGEAAALAAP